MPRDGTRDPNSWENVARHVLAELEHAREAREKMAEGLAALQVQVAILTTKAGIIGAASGIVTGAVVAFLVKYLGH